MVYSKIVAQKNHAIPFFSNVSTVLEKEFLMSYVWTYSLKDSLKKRNVKKVCFYWNLQLVFQKKVYTYSKKDTPTIIEVLILWEIKIYLKNTFSLIPVVCFLEVLDHSKEVL